MFFARDLVSGLVAGVCLAVGLAGHFVIPLLVQAQIIDVDAAQTGRRREGMYLSVGNVLVRASALITAIAFWLVGSWFGYESGDQPGPDPSGTFLFLTSAVPLALLLVSLVVALFLRTRDLELPEGSDIGLGAEGEAAVLAEGREAHVAESATKPLA
jgi:GPH family glycoside/pentoside/hexuronide:cation symporter